MSTPNQLTVSVDQARQSVGFLNQFLERLRQQKDVNVMNMFSYAEVANLHVSMVRLNGYLSEPVEVSTPAPAQTLQSTSPPTDAPAQTLQAPPQLTTI